MSHFTTPASAQSCSADDGRFALDAGTDGINLDDACGTGQDVGTAILDDGRTIGDGTNNAEGVEDSAGGDTVWTLVNEGGVEGRFGVVFAKAGSQVVNHGTIDGNAFFPGLGVHLQDGGTVVNKSEGTISGFGGIRLEGRSRVVNAGLIENTEEPAVAFLDNQADDVLELQPGSRIVGDVNAVGFFGAPSGLDQDLLRFGGAGVETFDVGLVHPNPDLHPDIAPGTDRQYFGFDAFEKAGSATWRLTGTNNDLDAVLIVRDGRLSADAQTRQLGMVVDNGVLSGTGRIGSLYVADGGVLQPGNSVGTLRVSGDADFQPGSVYRVHVDRDGASRTDIGADLTIDGGTVEAVSLEADGDDSVVGTYRILAADGQDAGTFDGVTVNYAFLTPSLRYDERGVELILEVLDLEQVALGLAETENQRRIALVLNSMDDNAPNYDAFRTLFLNLSDSEAPGVLEGLSGSDLMAMFGAAPSVTAELLTFIRQTGSFGGVFGGAIAEGDTPLVQNPATAGQFASRTLARPADYQEAARNSGRQAPERSPDSDTASGKRRLPVVWGRVVGRSADLVASGDLPGVDLRSAGVQVGIETPVTRSFTLGAAFGFERGRIASTGSGSLDLDSYGGALYGRYRAAPLRVSGALTYSRNAYDSERRIPVYGRQTGSTSADVWGADLETAHDLDLGWDGVTVAPLAGLRYTNVDQQGFTESGSAGLAVDGFSTDSLRTRLGVEGRLDADAHGVSGLTLSGRAVWSREVGDPSNSLRVSLLGSEQFQVQGQSLPRDMAEIGVSADMMAAETVHLFAAYDGRFGKGYADHRGQAGLKLQW